jgi:hypothetical protein
MSFTFGIFVTISEHHTNLRTMNFLIWMYMPVMNSWYSLFSLIIPYSQLWWWNKIAGRLQPFGWQNIDALPPVTNLWGGGWQLASFCKLVANLWAWDYDLHGSENLHYVRESPRTLVYWMSFLKKKRKTKNLNPTETLYTSSSILVFYLGVLLGIFA